MNFQKTLSFYLKLLVVLLLLGGCTKQDSHTAHNSLDWAGRYEGTLPAADCPGIQIVLELYPNQTYLKSTLYLERQVTPSIVQGRFVWTDGYRIKLDKVGDTERYFVAENKLSLLMLDGQKIKGKLAENFELKKK